MDKSKRKKFYRFLKENGIYAAFKENLINERRKIFLNEGFSYEELINYSFCWSATRQGHNFWSRYDIEWRKIAYE